MTPLWWTLPGPSEFLDRIAAHLRDGRSTVVRIPAHGPRDVAGAVARVHEADWRSVDAAEADGRPVSDLLLARFDPDLPPSTPRSPRTVAASERLHGQTLMVELDAGADVWSKWRTFLSEYADQSRALEAFQRTLFCVIVRGSAETELPDQNLCLTHHVWRGQVDDLDLSLFVGQHIRDQPGPHLIRRIRQAAISRLAAWDPEVAAALARLSLEELLHPAGALRDFGVRRGWGPDVLADDGLWRRGLADEMEGKLKLHPAALACADQLDELEVRIWSGQVAVLFPFLEEQRRAWLRTYDDHLHVPFTLPNGYRVTDRRDLELAHMLWQLRDKGVTLEPPRAGALRSLVEMRNLLAHFSHVPADLLLDPDLRRHLEEPQG